MKIRDKISVPATSEVISKAKVATVSERLQKIMDERNVRQADLARTTGISRGAISNYVLGRYEPKADIIGKLANALNCSVMWLWGYDVPMNEAAYLSELDDNPYELNLLAAFDKLSPDRQAYVSRWVENYAKQESSPSEILTEGEKKMLELFRRIPGAYQPAALDMLQAALEMQKKL